MIDRTAWMQKDIPPKPKPVSNKILGIGIVLAGGVVLTVALIIGLEFPRHVLDKVKDDQCIVDDTHHKFKEWTEDVFYTRYTRIYYFIITNKEGFLYNKEEPQVEERGPYVYKTTQKKIDVRFNAKTVTYDLVTSQKFEVTKTWAECGSYCKEDQQLTVINPYLLKKATQFGNDGNFLLSLIPNKINTVLALISNVQNGNSDLVYAMLGSFENANQTISSKEPHIYDFIFGSWIAKNDTGFKSRIMDYRHNAAFTWMEMRGLYDVFLDTQKLGVTRLQLTNQTLQHNCSCYWLSVTQGSASVSQGSASATPDSASVTQCGLVYFLRLFQTKFDQDMAYNYSAVLTNFLCTQNDSCFDIPSIESGLLKDYISALFYFLEHMLFTLTSYEFLSENGLQLVITKPQRDLAFGYLNPAIIPQLIPGVLSNHRVSGTSLRSLDKYTVRSCLSSRDISSNMKTTGFHSSRLNADLNAMAGYIDFTPVSAALKACVSCVSRLNGVHFFEPSLRRDVWFEKVHETYYKDVHVNQFELSPDNFQPDRDGITQTGLQNISDYTEYMSWMSTPHFYGFEDNVTSILLQSVPEEHKSVIEVEDVTGRVWRKKVRLQFNVGIDEKKIPVLTTRRINLDYFHLPVPMYWVEQLSEINPLQIEYYHTKVTRLMRVSCGGLIGIAIIAVCVVAAGVVITFVPLGLGRVAPMPHDVELHGR